MATFESTAYANGYIHRVVADQSLPVTATVQIPAGYALQTADKLYAFRVGADHSVDNIKVRFGGLDLAQTPTLTMDVGYEAAVATDDPNAFIAASTVARAGGQVQVENGGDDPFAVGALAPIAETIQVFAQPAASAAAAAGSGSLGPGASAGFVTISAVVSRRVNAPLSTDAHYDYPVVE
jgi:hypothetical protein